MTGSPTTTGTQTTGTQTTGSPTTGDPAAGEPSTRERGAATVYAAVLAVVATTACTITLHVAAVAQLQHRVTAAADLSALAASQAALGGEDGCDAARRIAAANATTMRACDLDDAAATVVVERAARIWGRTVSVRRTARAAPSDYRPAEEDGS